MLPKVSREIKALRELERSRKRQARLEARVIKKFNKQWGMMYARHVKACNDCNGSGCEGCKGLGYKKKKK